MEKNLQNRSRGFTLIEMMVTVALAAILLTVGIPSFRHFIVSNRVVGETNNLIAAFNTARSEAVKRNTQVTVCAATADLKDCSGSGNWATGWIVFVDGGTAGTVDGGDQILRVWPALGGGDLLTAVAGGSAAPDVRYEPSGFTAQAANDTVFTLKTAACKSTDPMRVIRVRPLGFSSIDSSPTTCQ